MSIRRRRRRRSRSRREERRAGRRRGRTGDERRRASARDLTAAGRGVSVRGGVVGVSGLILITVSGPDSGKHDSLAAQAHSR